MFHDVRGSGACFSKREAPDSQAFTCTDTPLSVFRLSASVLMLCIRVLVSPGRFERRNGNVWTKLWRDSASKSCVWATHHDLASIVQWTYL